MWSFECSGVDRAIVSIVQVHLLWADLTGVQQEKQGAGAWTGEAGGRGTATDRLRGRSRGCRRGLPFTSASLGL